MCSPKLGVDRAYFHAAISVEGRAAIGQRGGFLQAVSFDHHLAAQHLLDFHERPVSDDAAGFEDLAFQYQAAVVAAKLTLHGNARRLVRPFFIERLHLLLGNLSVVVARLSKH